MSANIAGDILRQTSTLAINKTKVNPIEVAVIHMTAVLESTNLDEKLSIPSV
jgi:hypothetical protein